MAICRYYQQGTCTFGSSCKFEHQQRSGGTLFSGSGSSNNDNIVNTLVTTVKQDMEQSTKGKQWMFSCYSPAKDCISIPGIDDICFEEMRSWAYEEPKMSPAYQQKIQELINSYTQKRQALTNPSNELKEVLRKIYNKEQLGNVPPNLFDAPKSAFGSSTGGQNTSGGLFGGPTQQQSSSIFGGQKSSSVFGQSSTPNQSSASIFGGQSNAASTQPQSSIFGGSAGGSSSLFGGQQKTAFGAPAQPHVDVLTNHRDLVLI